MQEVPELYEMIESHLLEDEKPSGFLNSLSEKQEFAQYPFRLLLELKDTEQSPVYHPEGNVWNHTMLVVDQAAERRNQSKDAKAFMWAALLHDIGKPATTRKRKGKITSYNHDKEGSKLAREFLSRLSLDAAFMDRVCSLILFHMQILYVVKGLPYADIPGMKAFGDIEEIALLGLCDRLGRLYYDREAEEKNIQSFLRSVKSI
jgi:putative nucleotidyltransferase with HDIG domain